MSALIPTTEPTAFVAGETLIWSKAVAGYTAADGWTLTYQFRGAAAGFDQVGAPDGSGWKITVPASVSGSLPGGVYFWQGWLAKAGEKHSIASGQSVVTGALPALDQPYDGRSQVKIILDAIDALIAGKATIDQQEYQISDRMLKRYTFPDLIAIRTQYARLYSMEQQAARLKKGGPFFKNILTRFDPPR